MYTYKPLGVCSKEITFDVDNNKIKNVSFVKGCKGNLQGISKLIDGMDATEAVTRLKGIKCQGDTSCPDQLARAIEKLVFNK